MYNHLMACCLKANGKVLREFKDTVYVPFGQEYSILLKNLNKKRAVVNITIDGTDVVPGGLVVDGNREVELERFLKDLNQGNRFKFIERTAAVENHRGSKVDDGLIRISFRYERDVPIQQYINTYTKRGIFGPTFGRDNSHLIKGSIDTGDNFSSMMSISAATNNDINIALASNVFKAQGETGITVEGSVSQQKFQKIDDFPLESEEHVLVIRVLGDIGQEKVTEAVTVKSKPTCKTCGKVNKATSKFCSECGTSLQII